MLKKIAILFTAFFIFQMNAFADDTATQTLTGLLQNVKTMKADFTQTITDKNASKIQHSSGHMAVQRPGKFRWQVTKPVTQLTVTNGNRIWVYDPDLEQVTIKSFNKNVGESPAMLLSNPDTALTRDFDVKAESGKNKLQWYLLTPKNPNSVFASIRLGFADSQIREMILQDHLGHTTAVEFYNVRNNAELAAALFLFKSPKGVDVIDETKSKT